MERLFVIRLDDRTDKELVQVCEILSKRGLLESIFRKLFQSWIEHQKAIYRPKQKSDVPSRLLKY